MLYFTKDACKNQVIYYLPMLCYTLTKDAYKNQDGILLIYVILYFNKECLQESRWYITYLCS